MSQDPLHTETAKPEDGARLADLRVAAMRPSLEAVGRFDPQRARDRFLSSFCAEDTRIILEDEHIAGFYVLRRCEDHLYLDHLYIIADCQGRGFGRQIIERIKEEARLAALPIRLQALNGQPGKCVLPFLRL